MELTFFKSLAEAADCAADELTRSLDEDIERMSWADEPSLSAEERRDELARLRDMKVILPLVRAAPGLLAEMRDCVARLEDYYKPAFVNGRLDAARAVIDKAMAGVSDKELSPIALARSATPFWLHTIKSYDGLELAPVAEYQEADGRSFCERVDDPRDGHFWSVYGHLPVGGVECLEDFRSEQEATAFAECLLSLYPNLHKNGLTRC